MRSKAMPVIGVILSVVEGEREADANPAEIERLQGIISRPDFVFETREDIAFCFACIGRTLAPEEQAALMLKEVLGFTAEEAAGILGVSEPDFFVGITRREEG